MFAGALDIALDEAGKFGERRDHDLTLTQADHCGRAIVGERPFDEVHDTGGRESGGCDAIEGGRAPAGSPAGLSID